MEMVVIRTSPTQYPVHSPVHIEKLATFRPGKVRACEPAASSFFVIVYLDGVVGSSTLD